MTRRRPARPRRRAPTRRVAALAALATTSLLAQQPYDVALRDGLLSIRSNGAPITEIAQALAAETGVSFVVTGDAGTPITTEIVDEPFAKAVAKLSPNHLLVTDGESENAAVVEVVLMLDDAASGGDGGDGGFLPSGAPADEIIGGEETLPLEDTGIEPPVEMLDQDPMSTDGASESGFQDDGSGVNDGFDPATEQPLGQ